MPAPSILVTFVDDDGDEFMVRIHTYHQEPQDRIVAEAQAVATRLVAEGHYRPRGELRYLSSERLNGA